jgi:hypothetical protein
MFRPALLSAFVLLAGCARSEEAANSQIENMRPPAINTALDGDEDELAVGTWQTGVQDDQPVLEFGPAGSPVLFSIGCDARRNLLLQRPGGAPAGDLPNMLVTVGSETRRFAVASSGGMVPILRGTLAPNDPFRNALINAATRIEVRIGDTQPLVMPPNPALAAYAERCASGEVRAISTVGNSLEANGSIDVVAGNETSANANSAN